MLVLAEQYGQDPTWIEEGWPQGEWRWTDKGVNRLLFLKAARTEADRLRERGFKPRGRK